MMRLRDWVRPVSKLRYLAWGAGLAKFGNYWIIVEL